MALSQPSVEAARSPRSHPAWPRWAVAAALAVAAGSGGCGGPIKSDELARGIDTLQALASEGRRPHPMAILQSVGLSERSGSRPTTLSGGESARAGLAVALANDPPLLLADEPTGEVDAANESMILDLLRARADAGTTVVVVTHSDRVAAAADRVVSLVDGRVRDAT